MSKFLVVLIAGLTIPRTSAYAQQNVVVYSNLGPGDGYSYNMAAGIYGPDSPTGLFSSGFSFAPSEGALLDKIEIAVSSSGTGTEAFRVDLFRADGPSGGPRTLIEGFNVSGPLFPFGQQNPLTTISSMAHPLLSAGSTYWLVASGVGDAEVLWNVTDPEVRGMFYSFQFDHEVLAANQHVGAFRITGIVPIPEPSTVGLFTMCLLIVGARCHFYR